MPTRGRELLRAASVAVSRPLEYACNVSRSVSEGRFDKRWRDGDPSLKHRSFNGLFGRLSHDDDHCFELNRRSSAAASLRQEAKNDD